MDKTAVTITVPAGELVEYGRDFAVQGRLSGPVPEDGMLTAELSQRGQILRRARAERKNDTRLWLAHPDLTSYPEELDPGKAGLVRFGFPELLVRDPERPLDSLGDASIKCWFSDTVFKAVIPSGTGKAQGRIFDGGLGLLDPDRQPYPMLEEGEYLLTVTLTRGGTVLAQAKKALTIGRRRHQAIVRFHPDAHRENMVRWCREKGFSVIEDPLPGYLDPYAGVWLYHMGLLPMYRANDIALYESSHVHLFVYLMDPTSTSYETELAYLQTVGAVGDPDRFTAYHYDVGEALLGLGKPWQRRGQIVAFPPDRSLSLCRVDLVRGQAGENRFDLSEANLTKSFFDLDRVRVPAGSTVALAGVLRPWQKDPVDFTLRRDNTYEIRDGIAALDYTLSDGRRETRFPLLERFQEGKSLGTSVYEFYNLFTVPQGLDSLTIRIQARDRNGPLPGAWGEVRLQITNNLE